MKEITLQELLEAGCHFGHKSERWHPKAAAFIYTKKDGIHIIDLAKTKAGLTQAAKFIKEVASHGDEVLFVATKRQAQGVVKEEATAVGAPYLVERWIGGFLTNWDSIKKNIEKINRLSREQEEGGWKKFPKHEQSKLTRYLHRLKIFYGGVLHLTRAPLAMFVIDVKKEDAAVREGHRMHIPVVAAVDTNADPAGIEYTIPANDDAVGSIQLLAHTIAMAYKEGKDEFAKVQADEIQAEAKRQEEAAKLAAKAAEDAKAPETKKEVKAEAPKEAAKPKEVTKKVAKPKIVKKPSTVSSQPSDKKE
jgi:small subunit ribosomal protein S2